MRHAQPETGTPESRPLAVALESICRDYVSSSGLAVAAVRGASMQIAPGEVVAIRGRSGSGKTTLLHIMGTLDRPSKGNVCIFGSDVSTSSDAELAALRSWTIGFVFQSFCLIEGLDAKANVATGLLYRGLATEERNNLARLALDRVGLRDRADHLPDELSGGERQRVAFARAIAGGRALVIADEPTGNLDSHTAADLWTLIRDLGSQGVSIVVATHDHPSAVTCDREYSMSDGFLQL